MIADFLTVKREYAPLIDLALGDWVQRFIVRDVNVLMEALAARTQPRPVADLGWLRRSGLAGALVERAAAVGAILGVCGGYQMLGERVLDPDGVESAERDVAGLGLLPVVTRFQRDKVTQPVRLRLGDGVPLLDAAGGQEVTGYEIHCGRVEMSVVQSLPASPCTSPFSTARSTSAAPA